MLATKDTSSSCGSYRPRHKLQSLDSNFVHSAVVTTDFMTAEAYPFSMEFLTEVSRRIVNEVEGIALVTYK